MSPQNQKQRFLTTQTWEVETEETVSCEWCVHLFSFLCGNDEQRNERKILRFFSPITKLLGKVLF